MLTKFKKSFTIALAVVMCLTSVLASAAEWKIIDYDELSIAGGQVPIIYDEYENGMFTGRRAAWGLNAARREVYGDNAADPTDDLIDPLSVGLKRTATATFVNPWVDVFFPNNEFATLYADGVNTNSFANTGAQNAGKIWTAAGWTATGNVEYREVDFAWEVFAPFNILSITQAKLNIGGKAQWFGDVTYNYPVNYTGKAAQVVVQRVPYGFANYEITGPNQIELVPDDLDGIRNNLTGGLVPVVTGTTPAFSVTGAPAGAVAPVNYMNASLFTFVSGLTNQDVTTGAAIPVSDGAVNLLPTARNQYFDFSQSPVRVLADRVTDADVQIPRSYDYTLVGPSFDANGNQIAGGMKIAASSYQEGKQPHRANELASFGVANLLDTLNSTAAPADVNFGSTPVPQMCEITWTDGGYETTSPHRQFSYLTVDGVVMDGSYMGAVDGIHYWRPCIIAYTGAIKTF